MATIRKQCSKWHVQIRKNGHRQITKSFLHNKDAQAWARKIESEIERGVFLDTTKSESTLAGLILTRLFSVPYICLL